MTYKIVLFQSTYEGSQQEGVATGSSIATVLATDADQTGSVSAAVEYSLISGAVSYFNIDPSTGVITNNIVLVSVAMQCSLSFV